MGRKAIYLTSVDPIKVERATKPAPEPVAFLGSTVRFRYRTGKNGPCLYFYWRSWRRLDLVMDLRALLKICLGLCLLWI